MNFILSEYHRDVDSQELLSDLRLVAKNLGKSRVTMAEYQSNGRFHPSTFIRRFGSWLKVLDIAGLEQTRTEMNISEEDLFDNLESIWRRLGRQPRYHEVCKPFSKYSNGTYCKRFGSFHKALEAFVSSIRESTANVEVNSTKPQKSKKNPRSINYRTRFKVLQRDGCKCCICGASPAIDSHVVLHIDHVIPVSKGGSSDITNLQTLCSKCNLGKSNLM